MAWACRLGYTKRLLEECGSGRGRRQIRNNVLIILLISLINLSVVVTSSKFNCDPVKNCFCNQGMDEDEWEIQCPKAMREVFDITLKVKPLANGNAFLTLICDPEKPEMTLELLDGLNFKMEAQETSHNVTEVLVQYCPASTPTNPHVLKGLFSQMNLPLEMLTSFVFLPSPRYSTPFPLELFQGMPNLEILDLQKLNLASVPDLSELRNLKELKLRDNRIGSLGPDTFKTTQRLQHLDLSLNSLMSLPSDVFPDSLQHLNLAKNNLSQVSPETFARLKSLQELVLTRNPLNNLDRDAFTNTRALKHIQIDSAKFLQFPKFSNLPNLMEISISYRYHGMEEQRVNISNNEPMGLGLREPLGGTEHEFDVQVTDMPALTKIVFVNDGLTIFPHLENVPNLTTLLLSGNRIRVVPEQTLRNFLLLKTLNLSNNRIHSLGIINTPNLISLDLGNNELGELNAAMFVKLTKLESLYLSMNKIQTVDPKAFKSLSKLTGLDLSNNRISFEDGKTEDEFSEFGGGGGFFSDEFDYQSPLRFSMRLEKLDLSHNAIKTIFNDWKFLFGELKTLNLSHNQISFLHATTLSFSSSDLTLDVSYNNISSIAMDNAEFIIDDAAKRILRILVDGNPLNCDCNILAFKTFRLKGIYFKFTNLSCVEPIWLRGIQFRAVPATDLNCPVDATLGCPLTCNCWNVPANKTIAVDCSYRNLGDALIPDVHSINGKWAQFYDYTLNLAGNNISHLDTDRSRNFSSRILKIDLSENELTSLTFLSGLLNNNISSFYLAENKFSCADCDFHKILRSHFKQVPDYNNVSCLFVTESGYGEQRVVRYYVDQFPEDQVCLMNLTAEVQAMIVAASIFLVCVVIFIAVYFRYGWALRAYLYSKGLGCCFGFDEAEDDQEKIYDAFVSYSHKDEDWVLNQLVTRLEEQEGFKLCLHFRDWTPGDWIPDQIVRSVDKSRRTVVILSKHFVESVWSRLEFRAAHSQALSDKANRLILVMMNDDLKDQEVKDDDLRVYMKMNTYLKYGDPWFWHKLKYALPHNKKSTSAHGQYLKQQQRERAIQLDKLRAKMENTIVA